MARQSQVLRARTSLRDWCRAAGYEPAQHHDILIDGLADVASGQCDSLMVWMPPGAAKSTYTSMLFPPWFLCQLPYHSILAASHTMELAERFGRRARDLIREHPVELGIELMGDSSAANRWQLKGEHNRPGGEYLAAGAGRAIAGFRADLILCDDPIRGREEAESATQREKLKDWWRFDVVPRIKPGGRRVIVQTRWNTDDLSGWLIQEEGLIEDGGQWRVIRIPMVAEDANDPLGRLIGQRLWPEWFTDDMVRQAKSDPRVWNALYQQRPTSEEGTYWRRDWLHPVDSLQVPPLHTLRVYGGSDYATTKAGGDFTVHIVVGIDPLDRPWVLDLWREQVASDVWVDAWCMLVKKWRPLSWGEERGQIMGSVGPFLEREQRKQQAYCERLQFASVADKSIMGQSMRAQVATLGLWYDRHAPFRQALESELLAFPAGKWDDIHDGLSKVGMLLDTALSGQVPKAPDHRVQSGYRAMKPTGSPSFKVL